MSQEVTFSALAVTLGMLHYLVCCNLNLCVAVKVKCAHTRSSPLRTRRQG